MADPHQWQVIRVPALNWGTLTSCEKFRLDLVVYSFDPQQSVYPGEVLLKPFNHCPACDTGHIFPPLNGSSHYEGRVFPRNNFTARLRELPLDILSKQMSPPASPRASYWCWVSLCDGRKYLPGNVWLNKMYIAFPCAKLSMIDISAEMVLKEQVRINSTLEVVAQLA